jgi:hypothetical protein
VRQMLADGQCTLWSIASASALFVLTICTEDIWVCMSMTDLRRLNEADETPSIAPWRARFAGAKNVLWEGESLWCVGVVEMVGL